MIRTKKFDLQLTGHFPHKTYLDLGTHTKWGKGSKGGISPGFQPYGGVGKTRPREAFPSAPTGSEFNSDALARCPQPMPSTLLFYFFFGHVALVNSIAAQKESKQFPLMTKFCEVHPRNPTKCMYCSTPRDHHILPPLHRVTTPQ